MNKNKSFSRAFFISVHFFPFPANLRREMTICHRGWKLNNWASIIHYFFGCFFQWFIISSCWLLIICNSLFIVPDFPDPNLHYSFFILIPLFIIDVSLIQLVIINYSASTHEFLKFYRERKHAVADLNFLSELSHRTSKFISWVVPLAFKSFKTNWPKRLTNLNLEFWPTFSLPSRRRS